MVDENEFFRQATIKICGTLDIEKGLHSTLKYLQQYIPIEQAFLQYYEAGIGAIRTIASATASGGKLLDILTKMPDEAIPAIEEIGSQDHRRLTIVNRPEEMYPTARAMVESHGYGDRQVSIVHMPLLKKHQMSEKQSLGALVIVALGVEQYTEEHAKLLSSIMEPLAVSMSNALEHRKVQKLKELLADDNRYLHRELHRISGDEIIGVEFGLKHVMEMVRLVAPRSSPVLLMGETGVGKDVIANAIHFSSPRSTNPFVTVNSGAIPDSLLDSELFGHEKGAFTGAVSQRRGRFERAHQGTIFLDEIGELPPQAQIRLLRVLQHREIERVGSTKSIPVDVRVIAATHRNLEEMIASGQFREDLWFRLNVFPITIPPLRARAEDIPALVHHFIEIKSRQLRLPTGIKPSRAELDRLGAYHWPGNIRELENVVERALILYKGGPLNFNLHAVERRESKPLISTQRTAALPSQSAKLDDVITRHIQNVLQMTEGKVQGKAGAAEMLGINPSTLRNKMKKLGIPYGRRR